MQSRAERVSGSVASVANVHFQLYMNLLIVRMLHNIDRKLQPESRDEIYQSFPFLSAYDAFSVDKLYTSIEACEAETDGHLPIRALKQSLHIDDDALFFLLAASLIEEDLQFGALFAMLQRPFQNRYPSIGLLNWLLSDGNPTAFDGLTQSQILARHGLVTIKRDDDTPHLEWTLRVQLPILVALRGHIDRQPTEQITRQPAQSFPPIDALILSDDIRQQIEQIPAMMHYQQLDALVLRGMVGGGKRTIIGSLARHCGTDILLLEKPSEPDLSILGVLATLTHALPVIRVNAPPGNAIEIDKLRGYRRLVGITMGRTGGLSGTLLQRSLTINIPAPRYRERLLFWQTVESPIAETQCAEIVDKFLLTGGRIQRVADLANIQRQVEGRTHITIDDIQKATRAMNRQSLETLATPLLPIADWRMLVVNPRMAEALEMLKVRCVMREQLTNHVGAAFDNNLNRGVRALFSGPSGTGKTYAVRTLAGALNMDVYRVDLSSIVNKYIGETEKNLNNVFTYAEELDVLLLVDEGDSLMTGRTDVSSANDRYANLETNFLLQRLESYEGIVIITTNAAQRIDDAFMRRLDVVIDFERPALLQRRLLWQSHLPSEHDIDEQFLESVVQRCDLTGGQIRNIALNASLIALTERGLVNADDLDESLRREYQKASLPYPLQNR